MIDSPSPPRRTRTTPLNDVAVTMAHGSGGKAAAALLDEVFMPAFGNPTSAGLPDAATLVVEAGQIAYTTDSFVVQPIRFPGASIGELAINGTVNDLAVSGAQPRWLTAGFILEEGFPIAELRAVVEDMRQAAELAGVQIVAGDTKVVPHGAADQIFINTSGIGVIPPGRTLGAERVRVGDRLIISGPIAAHGMAVMIARGNLAITAPITSDCAPLNHLVEALYSAVADEDVRWMRDATRGGVATVLNELANTSGQGVLLDEEAFTVEPAVRGACDMLGIDPLYVANEGCFIAVVDEANADKALVALRGSGAEQASVIGQVVSDPPGLVAVRNGFGGTRLVDMLVTDPLPRIC
ncbi:MAG: hydrogenase expression/formation protein HypE [Propionibacteriaceae bacterium]|nr:hydrogenase expression/formation protein HypE [Propionibacteriaceae bacterium]